MRIVVLGGGFGGVTGARQLERLLRGIADAEITLVSRENFFVLTPLLFEACSGRLELRHCAQPIRAALRRTQFVEATIEAVDVQRQIVRAVTREGATYELPYDYLVVALGASTPSPASPPGGSARPTTCSRCHAWIGGFASSSTGRWRCSSGRTLPRWSCASSGSR